MAGQNHAKISHDLLLSSLPPLGRGAAGGTPARKGSRAGVAINATQAIERIRVARPDLVFLDINMPGLNGLRALRLIKQIDTTIPVLMVTANADNALAAEAIKLGAFSYIPKPRRRLDRACVVARVTNCATMLVQLRAPDVLTGTKPRGQGRRT